MPLQSTLATTIPGFAPPSTPDLLLYDLQITSSISGGVVRATAHLRLKPYRADEDGSNAVPVGSRPPIPVMDPFRMAEENPKIATALLALNGAVQQYVSDRGF